MQQYKWKNRLLLLFAPANDSIELMAQLSEIQQYSYGFEERDVRVLTCTSSSDITQKLRFQFEVDYNKYTCILIGKDGAEKMREHSLVYSHSLFEFVDNMPMRRWEMNMS